MHETQPTISNTLTEYQLPVLGCLKTHLGDAMSLLFILYTFHLQTVRGTVKFIFSFSFLSKKISQSSPVGH